MYQALLTRRYLTSKLMPFLAVAAVMLCTATVLITWSVMGGFLKILLTSGRGMVGDVQIAWPTTGLAHYDDLIKRLEADELVFAAAPVIDSFGVIELPDTRVMGIQVRGIDGASFARVTDYANTLYWRPLAEPTPKDPEGLDPRLGNNGFFESMLTYWSGLRGGEEIVERFRLREWAARADAEQFARMYEDGLALRKCAPGQARSDSPAAAVLGVEVHGFARRTRTGFYRPSPEVGTRRADGGVQWFPGFIGLHNVIVRVLPLDKRGRAINMVSREFPVANEVQTSIYEINKNLVILPLGELQTMLRMDAARKVKQPDDPYDVLTGGDGREAFAEPELLEEDPARVTTILVRAKDGITSETLRTRCLEIYEAFADAHPGEVPDPRLMRGTSDANSMITTWERSQATMVAIVQKETAMVLFVLGIISFTCTGLILAIFWGMVSEKTKDIGVLRSMGAGWWGIAWLWLRYGLAIGVLGSLLGGFWAYLIIWNINPIHDWLGERFGMVIWDPAVYLFPEIPHTVETWRAAVVLGGGVIFSVLGALIPAVRAASLDPVRALRFE